MRGPELVAVLEQVTTTLEDSIDEFRELDAAVGDGDLGVTVRMSCSAVRDALGELDDDVTVSQVLREVAMAIADANPSTFASLTAGGLLKAARAVGDDPVDLAGGAAAARAFFDDVADRGGAELGDKTVLDAIAPALDVLEAAEQDATTADVVDDAVGAAKQGAEETEEMSGRKGRARWVADKGKGTRDPGSVVFVRFMQALQQATTSDG